MRGHGEHWAQPPDGSKQNQVSLHAAEHRQGRHPRPGPVPRPEPGARPLLLDAAADAGAAVAQEHLRGAQARLPRAGAGGGGRRQRARARIPAAAAAARWLADAVGRARRAAAERVPDGARAHGQQPRGPRLGAADAARH